MVRRKNSKVLSMMIIFAMAFTLVAPMMVFAAVDVTSVTLDKPTVNLVVGGPTATLTATLAPADAGDLSTGKSSSNSDVVTISYLSSTQFKLTPVSPGTAIITISAGPWPYVTATCEVTVAAIPATGVTLDQATLTLVAGGATGALVKTVAPADATNKSVTWSSSNEAVATVAGGVVTPINWYRKYYSSAGCRYEI